jgi:hypothetical protein
MIWDSTGSTVSKLRMDGSGVQVLLWAKGFLLFQSSGGHLASYSACIEGVFQCVKEEGVYYGCGIELTTHHIPILRLIMRDAT